MGHCLGLLSQLLGRLSLPQQVCHLCQKLLVHIEKRVQAHTLLIHRPGSVTVWQHLRLVKSHRIVHTALPCGSDQRAVGRAILADTVAVVVAIGIPPAVELEQFGEQFGHEILVARCPIDIHGSPCGKRRFGVAPVVGGLVSAYVVGHHAIGGLMVEEGTHLVLGHLRMEEGVARGNLPRVPCPESFVETYVRGQASVVQQVACRRAPVAVQGHHGFHQNPSIEIVAQILPLAVEQCGKPLVPSGGILFQTLVRIHSLPSGHFGRQILLGQGHRLEVVGCTALARLQHPALFLRHQQTVFAHRFQLRGCGEADGHLQRVFQAADGCRLVLKAA